MATVTRATPQPDGYLRSVEVVALTPEQCIDWLNGKLGYAYTADGRRVKLGPPWNPGNHFALLGKTREGKTNFAVWILGECRTMVLALDPKGGDESLSNSGWPRITEVPPPGKIQDQMARKIPTRLIVGIENTRTAKADLANRKLMGEAIEYVRQAGGFGMYVDEHQIISDQRMFNLGPAIARAAISAARDGVSVVASMQYLTWVEKAPTRQASLIAICRTKDRNMVKLGAEVAGRDWQTLAAVIDELPKYHWAVIPDELRAPIVVVKPPKVT